MTDRAAETEFAGIPLVDGAGCGEVVASDTALSFWGGIDPASGAVIDRHHPLCGQQVAGRILAIPGGRGSCTGSAVMLELLLNGKAPAALVLGREDEILTLGVVVAEEVFGCSIPVVALAPGEFRALAAARHARVAGGRVVPVDGPRPAAGTPPGSPPASPPASPHAAPAPPGLAARDVALSQADRAMLAGERGRAAQVAMRIVLRMARLQGAARLIDVERVHVDGCIYTGPASLAFAQRLAALGGRVAVPTTLNAISVDRRGWRAQGVDPAFGEPAAALADAYLELGAAPSFTCAPYLLADAPARGEQIAWAESNAVVYANSVLGARTMKYPDFLDICIALTGRAPLAGCHLDAGRRARLLIDLPRLGPVDDAFYPLLGHHVGMLAAERIPVVAGLEGTAPSADDLKAFGAAFATTSGAPMFHILGVTPEAATLDAATGGGADIPTLAVRPEDLAASWHALGGGGAGPVDLVSLGNPHFSVSEFAALAALCRGRTRHDGVGVVVTAGRAVVEAARAAGALAPLEAFGVRLVTDTCWCMIGEPLIPPGARTIITNSAKYAHYGPGLTGRRLRFGSLAACVEAACTGVARGAPPGWLATADS